MQMNKWAFFGYPLKFKVLKCNKIKKKEQQQKMVIKNQRNMRGTQSAPPKTQPKKINKNVKNKQRMKGVYT